METNTMVKKFCTAKKVKCGYRLPNGECPPKEAWPTQFECFEKNPTPQKQAPNIALNPT
jgi:hypothetical protein